MAQFDFGPPAGFNPFLMGAFMREAAQNPDAASAFMAGSGVPAPMAPPPSNVGFMTQSAQPQATMPPVVPAQSRAGVSPMEAVQPPAQPQMPRPPAAQAPRGGSQPSAAALQMLMQSLQPQQAQVPTLGALLGGMRR